MSKKHVVVYGARVTCPHCSYEGILPDLKGNEGGILTCGKCRQKFKFKVNKRKNFRRGCVIEGKVVIHDAHKEIPIEIRDISRSGVQFCMRSHHDLIKIGREYVLNFILNGKEVAVRARIVRSVNDGFGACFVFMHNYSKAEAVIVSYLM